jgi:hypothetical protein
MDTMETEPDAADAIPIVNEVREEFEALRRRFPFLAPVQVGDRACWQLRGFSPFNLDLNITFSFVQISDTMITGSRRHCLNAYLSSDPASLEVKPVAINALTPRWTLCIGDSAQVTSYQGEVSSRRVVGAIASLMNMQTNDDEVEHTPFTLRCTKLARLDDDVVMGDELDDGSDPTWLPFD